MIELKSARTPTNGDKIRAMNDEELAKELTKNPSIPCRMCEYWNNELSYCGAPNGFTCVTAYAEALMLDWLHQPAPISRPHENGMSARGHENIGENNT